MAKLNFYLKDPNSSNEESLIYLFFSYKNRRLKYSAGEKVLPKHWNPQKQRVPRSFTGSLEINAFLQLLEERTFIIYRRYSLENKIPTTSQLREELDEMFNRSPNSQANFFAVYEEFVMLTKPRVKLLTTKKYLSLRKHLERFQRMKKMQLEFEIIDVFFFDQFLSYFLDDLGLINNTIGKYVATLKTFLNWASERGYNKKMDFQKFKVYLEDADIVYLEYDELMRLYNLDLSHDSRLEKVRDTFCLCCFTGLRFSDVKQLQPEHIKSNAIQLVSLKTKQSLFVPLNEFARAIIDKYLDHPEFLSVISNQKMNAYLKELCQLAKINQQVTVTKFRGSERIENTVPKHDLVTTHTARRTFVTLSLEQGMRPEIVMQITGHKSYRIFKKYIKITDKVKALEMRQIWDRKDRGGENPFLRVG